MKPLKIRTVCLAMKIEIQISLSECQDCSDGEHISDGNDRNVGYGQ